MVDAKINGWRLAVARGGGERPGFADLLMSQSGEQKREARMMATIHNTT